MHKPSGAPHSMRAELFNMIKTATCLNSSSSDTGKGKSRHSSKSLMHGFHLVEGKAGHDMEDYHVAEYRIVNKRELGLFAIFDGHLGDLVPSYLREHLFNNILREPDFWTDGVTSIKSAYQKTNKYILENPALLGPGGSTAVTAIVIDDKLLVANIGDSRAVLCTNGTALQLTVDHEPHAERQRIKQQGGFVTALPGDVPRVNGQLAVARAFGDQNLKAHLSSEPDVKLISLNSSMEFVILASDGLWKVLGNQDAVDLIRHIKDPQVAAKRLTTEALNKKSKDDISCIVVRFQH